MCQSFDRFPQIPTKGLVLLSFLLRDQTVMKFGTVAKVTRLQSLVAFFQRKYTSFEEN
jgi:hypothetical protein